MKTSGTTCARRVAALMTSLAMLACSAPEGAPSASRAPLTPSASLPVTLDVRPDGTTLAGAIEPVREGTDADRIIVLDESIDGLAGARVIDARFVDGGIVVLGADRVLRFHQTGGDVIALDEEVYGPLSIAGHVVAYVRGGPPDLELVRADLETGGVEAMTQGMAPVWSPALSSDAREIVFVSGIEGTPRLHRRTASGAIEALAPTSRTPSAATAPRWTGSTLVFEDESGVVALDLDRGAVLQDLPDAHGLTVLRDGALGASVEGGALAPLSLSGGAR